jgi:DNA polymerase/3'-5' exonuclease PolX
MELHKALKIANNLVAQLGPYCDIINIAGSCRRNKVLVKDIELVCLPMKTKIEQFDLFGPPQYDHYLRNPHFCRIVKKLGKILKGKPEGKKMQIDLPEGIKLDLFMPSDFDYYRIFAIRTGSADYSKNVIARAWREIGWVGTENGLRRYSDCEKENNIWKCYEQNPELPPIWKSEEEFFEWLGLKWIEPSERIWKDPNAIYV